MKNTIFYFKQLILSFLLCFVAIWANAQNQVVKGTVKDVLGEAVIGANVTEVGTTNGTITDINGDFSLNVSPKGKLRISFIGYQVQTVDVAGRKSLEIVLKEDTEKSIKNLKGILKYTVMLTGDSYLAAENIAEKIGINKFYAELLPDQKVEKLEELINSKNKDKSVIFVGDGINDAPVITRADAGIAMGGLGSDAAIEAADAVIMDDNPNKIYKTILIARKTMSIVKQNIVFALGVKALFLILGAMGFVTMWGAVFADTGVALLAVLNSLRALRA